MKKEKTDYFKELEKFSSGCMHEAENFLKICSRQNPLNNVNDSISELRNLTVLLKKEYFTPIERDDIYLLACTLSDIELSIKRLNSAALQSVKLPTEIMTLSNFLYSSAEKINETVKLLSEFPKSDIYTLIFEVKKTAERALNFAKNILQSNFCAITESFKDCIRKCAEFSDRMIYIHLKNT